MVKELELKIRKKKAQIVEMRKGTEAIVNQIRDSEMTMESLCTKMKQQPNQTINLYTIPLTEQSIKFDTESRGTIIAGYST